MLPFFKKIMDFVRIVPVNVQAIFEVRSFTRSRDIAIGILGVVCELPV